MSNLPRRKNIRLKDYDYSQSGFYFITICTKNREMLLSNVVGGGFHAAPDVQLTLVGQEIVKSIEFIDKHYSNVLIDKYIIMPNHIHLIIILQGSKMGEVGNPALYKVVGQLKSYTNKRYNEINKMQNLGLWQRNYYEHIIRNEQEYREIWEYIEENPLKWEEDQYYICNLDAGF